MKKKTKTFSLLCFQVFFTIFALASIVVVTKYPKVFNQKISILDTQRLKKKEMLEPVVMIATDNSLGTGVIVKRSFVETTDMFDYEVITSSHVISPRMINVTTNVDVITGKEEKLLVDTGFFVYVFPKHGRPVQTYIAYVNREDQPRDVSIITFSAKEKISVARLATKQVMGSLRIFDQVFSVSCPNGLHPTPTVGIISRLTLSDPDIQQKIIENTANTLPGSSGGGLFKEYEGHYYLIGIHERVFYLNTNQIVPYLSFSISLEAVIDSLFGNQN